MIVRRCAGVAAAAIAVSFVAAATPVAAAAVERPTVVVTTNILGDVVGEVAGDVAEVVVLMPPSADPHDLVISARQAEVMEEAALIVYNGLGLEENVLDYVVAAADVGAPVLEVAPLLDPIPYGDEAGDDAGRDDPHVWTDPGRMVIATELIGEAVGDIEGVDAATVTAAAERYGGEVAAMDASMEAQLAVIPAADRQLVTNHNVFSYFAERFDFEVVATVVPSGTTLASPSAADLEEVAAVLEETGVPAIFADSSQPARLAEVLAEEVDLDVEVISLYTESLGPPGSGADTYLGMLDTNTDLIVEGLT